MDYKVVKNRIVSMFYDMDVFFRMAQLEVLRQVEIGLDDSTTVEFYLKKIQSQIASSSNTISLKGLNNMVTALIDEVEAIDSLKSFHYDLFQSGYPVELLKTYTEADVVSVLVQK